MVNSVTFEPGKRSLIPSACSNAFKSSGLKMAGSAALFTVPSAFIASFPTLRVSGTCLANTIMLNAMFIKFRLFLLLLIEIVLFVSFVYYYKAYVSRIYAKFVKKKYKKMTFII